MTNIYNIELMVEELTEAAGFCNDELGEFWETLIRLHDCCDFISTELKNYLEVEIEAEYKKLKEEFKFVEKEVKYKRKRLVHISESEYSNSNVLAN